jgi:site-specific recombinase XerD
MILLTYRHGLRASEVCGLRCLKSISRIGEAAKLPFPIHPQMLRHSTGYKLANDGHDTRSLQHYMGHRNIMHTVRYTEMAPDRFKNFWKD